MKKGALKVRIPNPHKSGALDVSLVKEILGQAGIEADRWDSARAQSTAEPGQGGTLEPLAELHVFPVAAQYYVRFPELAKLIT